jgi:hypothetical protein
MLPAVRCCDAALSCGEYGRCCYPLVSVATPPLALAHCTTMLTRVLNAFVTSIACITRVVPQSARQTSSL